MRSTAVAGAIAICLVAEVSSSWIHTGTRGDPHFYDEHGRVRIFHGSNRVKKSFPWYFHEMLDADEEFALMKKMGFNVMRLGFMWTGYNPQEGVFNQTYIDTVKTIVRKMADHGVYALLDMHEDVLSSNFCLYDGAPQWVVNKSTPRRAFPWPFKGDCSSRGWMQNTLTEAAAQAYQDLYDNKSGMLDDLANFWQHAAEQFRDEAGVIGYEIMNEPFAGNFYRNPLLLEPAVAGSKNLARMNEAVAKAIRKEDDRHVVFYEPVTWGMFLNGKVVGSGFDQVPGGDAFQNRSAFSYHYYCASLNPNYGDHPLWTRALCDSFLAPHVFNSVQKDLAKVGGAAMMTEGLACEDRSMQECHQVLKELDGQLFSWTDYGDSQGDEWAPTAVQQEAWARTYARAVAGRPLKMSFDPKSKAFEFCYTLDLAISAPTEIFASSTFSYSSGMAVSTTGNISANASAIEDVVLLRPTADAKTGEEVCVHILPKGNAPVPTVV